MLTTLFIDSRELLGKDAVSWFSCVKRLLITVISGNHYLAFLANHCASITHIMNICQSFFCCKLYLIATPASEDFFYFHAAERPAQD